MILPSLRIFIAAALLLPCAASAQLTNVALGKPVTTSGNTYNANNPTYAADKINDGSGSTFSHPETPSSTGFHYTINLGSQQALNKLRFVNRTGCCPERLTNYRVSVFAANPAVAGTQPVWTTVLRSNGTNSGDAGADEATAGLNPTGVFAGQWLRIQSLSTTTQYTPQIAEYEALTSPNLALYKLVTASGALQAGFPATNLTDGNPTTFSHPSTTISAANFTWELDLAGDFALDRLVLYSRQDCCPERLKNFRVQIYADNAGTPGALRWTGDLRTDGSSPGAGAGEVVRAEQGTGEFRGRFVRVINLSGETANPQLAEIEAYRATPPVIRYFTTDAGNITKTGNVALPSQATLSWLVQGAATVSISPAPGSVAAGSGTAAVSPSAATTYTLTASNTAGSVTATILIAVDAAQQPPRLNEILTDNANGLADENGNQQDWIEIFNPNNFTLPLGGAHLSDNSAIPTLWTFPVGAVIPPNGFLVVFASGRNLTDPAAPLHTNFSLSKSGEVLALHAPGGSTLWSRIPADWPTTPAWPAQTVDTSYGLNAAGEPRFFRPPTPGAVNATAGFTSVVADTSFLPKRGIYSTAQSVSITTATPGATIRYTTNGTRPTETTGTVYTGPISVATTTVIRAAAFLAGAAPTNVDTHTYIFPASVQSQSTMRTNVTNDAVMGPQIPAALTDLPSISLTMPSTAAVNQDTEVETAVEWLHNTDPLQHKGANAGVTLFGGAYTTFNKRSFRLTFRSEYGDSKFEAPLFTGHEHGLRPQTSFDSLELRNGSHDMAMRGFYMSNLFTDQVLMEMGHLAPHGRMVHLYLNGTYWGMYHLRERWNAAMHSDYLGGSRDDYEAINGNLNVGGWADPGTPFDGDGTAWEYIKKQRNNYNLLRSRVDMTNLTDFMIAFMFGNSEDEWRSVSPNSLIGAGSGARFIMNDADGWLSINSSNAIAAWDGNDNNTTRSSSWNSATSTFTQGRTMGDGPAALLSAFYLVGGTEYRMFLADRIHKHLFGNGVLTPAKNDARLRAMCTPIERAFIPESARWSYDTTQNRTWASWKGARDVCLNSWIPNRTNTVLGYFRAGTPTTLLYSSLNAPVFSQNGGTFAPGFTFTMSVASMPVGGTIRYTLDGSDPRLPGGAVAPGALTYTAAIPLTQNTIVRARTLSGTTWSALQESFFQLNTSLPVPPGAVVPSEIHFNPLVDGDEEFIELMNVSTGAVNLRGCSFTAGLEFTFSDYRDTLLAPGQRIVLVASEFAHRRAYGWDRSVGAIYAGNLNNAGEILTFTCGGTTVFSVPFLDTWQMLADGGGHSLTLANRAFGADLSSASNWRPSVAAGGTPGTAEPGSTFSGSPGADADSDGISAFAEYALGGSDNVFDPTAGITAERQPEGSVVFSYVRAAAADDAVVSPQISQDLNSWQGGSAWLVPHSQERLPDGRILTRFTAGPEIGSGRAFFRVTVTPRP